MPGAPAAPRDAALGGAGLSVAAQWGRSRGALGPYCILGAAVRMRGMPRPGFQFSLRFFLFVLTPIVALAAWLYPALNSLVLVWAGYLLLAALFIKALRTPP